MIVVEPGGVKTPIWSKGGAAADELLAEMPGDVERNYGSLVAGMRREAEKIDRETGLEPAEVARVIGRALTARRPRARYLVGRDAKSRALLVKLLPARVTDALVTRTLRS